MTHLHSAPDPSGRRRVRLVGLLAFAMMLGATSGALGAGAASQHPPVLGYKDFAGGYGSGWGTAHPKVIDNGGDPAGIADHLRWTAWGRRAAFAVGKTYANKPAGGYYSREVKIRLRASDLGVCFGKLAYRRLYYREAHRPGGAVQRHWHPWATTHGDICQQAFA